MVGPSKISLSTPRDKQLLPRRISLELAIHYTLLSA